MILSRKYYKSRLWKITTEVIPMGAKPHCGQGHRFLKSYWKRAAIGQPFEFIKGIVQEVI